MFNEALQTIAARQRSVDRKRLIRIGRPSNQIQNHHPSHQQLTKRVLRLLLILSKSHCMCRADEPGYCQSFRHRGIFCFLAHTEMFFLHLECLTQFSQFGVPLPIFTILSASPSRTVTPKNHPVCATDHANQSHQFPYGRSCTLYIPQYLHKHCHQVATSIHWPAVNRS